MPRYKEELEILKFICTDFWSCVYKKQVDNLRTNHQGVYVLHDNEFRFFSKLSNGTQYLKSAPKVWFKHATINYRIDYSNATSLFYNQYY